MAKEIQNCFGRMEEKFQSYMVSVSAMSSGSAAPPLQSGHTVPSAKLLPAPSFCPDAPLSPPSFSPDAPLPPPSFFPDVSQAPPGHAAMPKSNYFTSLLLRDESCQLQPKLLDTNPNTLPGDFSVCHPDLSAMVDFTFGIVRNTFKPEVLMTHTISGKRGNRKLNTFQMGLIKQQVITSFSGTEKDWVDIVERLALKQNKRHSRRSAHLNINQKENQKKCVSFLQACIQNF